MIHESNLVRTTDSLAEATAHPGARMRLAQVPVPVDSCCARAQPL